MTNPESARPQAELNRKEGATPNVEMCIVGVGGRAEARMRCDTIGRADCELWPNFGPED